MMMIRESLLCDTAAPNAVKDQKQHQLIIFITQRQVSVQRAVMNPKNKTASKIAVIPEMGSHRGRTSRRPSPLGDL